jgi:hypothetical protein
MTFEAFTGTLALTISFAGWVLGQSEIAASSGSIVGLITQFGGLGLAVWLVYQHTTVTIPSMQREHREERQIAWADFKAEIDAKRKEYLESLQRLTEIHTAQSRELHEEVLQSIKENACKAKNLIGS